jgi:hypothetical protein
MPMTTLATLPEELAEHWRNVLTDAGLVCELRDASGGLDIRVPEEHLEQARALFEPPFEGEDEAASEDGPALGVDERTEPLVATSHVVIADRLTEALHRAGLFAAIQSGATTGVFGMEGPPQFTVVVAEAKKEAALRVAVDWAKDHANDFSSEEQVDLNDFLKIWAKVLLSAGR